MLRKICCLAFCLLLPLEGLAQSCVVPERIWDRPRSGLLLAAVPELRDCVRQQLAQPDRVLLIHHAQTDEATLRAAELRYWLIALAVDSTGIDLKNDLQPNEPLRMEVKDKQ